MVETEKIWQWLAEISDPEIPVLSIVDLGIVRKVAWQNGRLEVIITPTYSGCPAMEMIKVNIEILLSANNIGDFIVLQNIEESWTTDWITEAGKQKLKEYGIAPPMPKGQNGPILCPQCGSSDTKVLSQFGSTACKALYQCNQCLEAFDYFKCH